MKSTEPNNDIEPITSRQSLIGAIKSGTYNLTDTVGDTTEYAMLRLPEFEARINKYFDFILSKKIPGFEEKHRDNFKKNLWKIFLERTNFHRDKTWGMACITQTGYLEGMLRGFCFGMDKIIEASEQGKDYLTVDFLNELHKAVTKSVVSETIGRNLEKIGGEFTKDTINVKADSRSGFISLNYVEFRLQQLITNAGNYKKLYAKIIEDGYQLFFNSRNSVAVSGSTAIPSFVLENLMEQFAVDVKKSIMTDQILRAEIRKFRASANYEEFARKCLEYHPWRDANGRIFNHLLNFLDAIFNRKSPVLPWGEKIHEYYSTGDFELVRKEGEAAFHHLVLQDEEFYSYIQNSAEFDKLLATTTDAMAQFMTEENGFLKEQYGLEDQAAFKELLQKIQQWKQEKNLPLEPIPDRGFECPFRLFAYKKTGNTLELREYKIDETSRLPTYNELDPVTKTHVEIEEERRSRSNDSCCIIQ